MSIQFKRSSGAGLIPLQTQLVEGELSINLFDKKLFTMNQRGEVVNIGFSQEYADETFLALSGGVMKGRLSLKSGTLPTVGPAGLDEVVSRRYIDSLFGAGDAQVRANVELDKRYLKLSGGTVGSASSKLYLNYLVDESQSQFQAAHMGYVMDNYAHLTRGANMQGYLSLVKDPVNSRHATPKTYVDGLHNNAIQYVNSNYTQAVNYTNQQISTVNSTINNKVQTNGVAAIFDHCTLFYGLRNGNGGHTQSCIQSVQVWFDGRGSQTIYFPLQFYPYSPKPTIVVTREMVGGIENDFNISDISWSRATVEYAWTGDGKGGNPGAWCHILIFGTF